MSSVMMGTDDAGTGNDFGSGTLAGAGTGVISADGGNGNGGGGGGGGRILVSGSPVTYSGTYTVAGGIGPGAGQDGSIGTIFFIP